MTEQEQIQIEDELPVYEAPQVVTFTERDILDELGPAQTSGYLCPDDDDFGFSDNDDDCDDDYDWRPAGYF